MSSAAPPGPDGQRRPAIPTLGTVTTAPLPPGVRVRTRPIDDPGGLLELLPDERPLCWVRGGEGLVGWGEVARFTASGPARFAEADAWWRAFAAGLEVHDEVGAEGTGPGGVHQLHLRRLVAGLRGDRAAGGGRAGRRPGVDHRVRRRRAGGDPAGAPRAPQRAAAVGRRPAARGRVPRGRGRGRAPDARRGAGQGGARARPAGRRRRPAGPPVPARAAWPGATRRAGRSRWTGWSGRPRSCCCGAAGRPWRRGCWRGRRGRRRRRRRTGRSSRGGCCRRTRTGGSTRWPSSRWPPPLRAAVRRRSTCRTEPGVLALRNVSHLVSDVHGKLDRDDPASLLRLAAAVHPTAAVGGTPREAALALIAELEGMDRGRYAGPVGWMDARRRRRAGHRAALRAAGRAGRAAVRGLRGGGRLGPGHRGPRGRGEAAPGPRGAGRRAVATPRAVPRESLRPAARVAQAVRASARWCRAAAQSYSVRTRARYRARLAASCTAAATAARRAAWPARRVGAVGADLHQPQPGSGREGCATSAGSSTRACGDARRGRRARRGRPGAACRRPARTTPACSGAALLQQPEDPAAAVVEDDDRQVGARLVRADHEPGRVVQQREVAEQRVARVRRGPAPRRPPSRPCRRSPPRPGWPAP